MGDTSGNDVLVYFFMWVPGGSGVGAWLGATLAWPRGLDLGYAAAVGGIVGGTLGMGAWIGFTIVSVVSG